MSRSPQGLNKLKGVFPVTQLYLAKKRTDPNFLGDIFLIFEKFYDIFGVFTKKFILLKENSKNKIDLPTLYLFGYVTGTQVVFLGLRLEHSSFVLLWLWDWHDI